MAQEIVENAVNCHKGVVRPVANFSPSLWGDQFIDYNYDTQVIIISLSNKISKAIEELKDDVKSKLTSGRSKLDTINLIDTLERLGISYHFENDIEQKLEQLFNMHINYEDESYDLYTVAVHFRVFRQHGYRISCEVFSKFKDVNGKFYEAHKSDAKGLLSLYEAAHLRIHGEDILEEALAFATTNLKSIAPNLDSRLRKQVLHGLVQPLHFGYRRIEQRNFISIYDGDESLLRFAKLDYNLVQMLHKKELQELSSWWKELDFVSILPYARDRMVECFFWATGIYHEPQYSRARIMLTKVIAMISIADDTYDAYGTMEELDILTEAIERWNISEIDRLPEYIRPFYKALLKLYEQFNEELTREGRSYATSYSIESLKELVRCYQVEAKWFIEGYLPSFDEYLQNALITCTYCYLKISSLMGCKSATRDDFEWLSKKPKMVRAGLIICRTIDDVATYEVEKNKGQIATGIECYMKENVVTKQEAMNKFLEMAINAWKDMNEECLKPYNSSSRDVRMKILNFATLLDVTYKNNEDGYTHPEKVLKPHIIALFMDPVHED